MLLHCVVGSSVLISFTCTKYLSLYNKAYNSILTWKHHEFLLCGEIIKFMAFSLLKDLWNSLHKIHGNFVVTDYPWITYEFTHETQFIGTFIGTTGNSWTLHGKFIIGNLVVYVLWQQLSDILKMINKFSNMHPLASYIKKNCIII